MSLQTHHTVESLDSLISINGVDTLAKQNDIRFYRKNYRYALQILRISATLMASDLLALASAFLMAFLFMNAIGQNAGPNLTLMFFLISGAFLFINTIQGIYPGNGVNPIIELRQSIITTTVLFSVFYIASFAYGAEYAHIPLLGYSYALALLFVPLVRSLAKSLFSHFEWWGQPTLIFGEWTEAQKNYDFLASHPRLGFRPVGIVSDSASHSQNGDMTGTSWLGPMHKARLIIKRQNVSCAVIAMPDEAESEVRRVVENYTKGIPQVLIVPKMDGFPILWNRTSDWGGMPAIGFEEKLLLPIPRIVKRITDLAAVIAGGVFVLPLVALIAFLIKLTSSGPVIFGHERIGRGGRRFKALKFRTMYKDADKVLQQHLENNPQLREEWEKDHKLKNDPRITLVGRLLRQTSLDELPQLWNILRGDMSLVGPRPIVEAEIPKYAAKFSLYTRVVPGLSGLWQISGRNNTTYAERVRLDEYYVRNWSPWMDLYILARTVKVVIAREGAY